MVAASQTCPPATRERETQAEEVRPRLRVPVGTAFPGETTNRELYRRSPWVEEDDDED
jgi:hypothetical protein